MADPSQKMFLFLEFKGKVTLDPARTITVGRTPKNDIVISSLTVSRVHASINFEGGSFVIKDLKSQNGTFLNGSLIKQAKLKNGDIIKIGGYPITVHKVEQEEQSNDVTLQDFEDMMSSTIDMRREAFSLMVGNVRGDLSSLGIDEIVQIIEVNKKTGALTLTGPENVPISGTVYFCEGEAVHAEYDNVSGQEAATELLQMTRGSFEFINEEQSPQRTITKSTIWLLYESHRLRSERMENPFN